MLTALVVLGALGMVVLLAGLVFGEVLDGAFDVALPGDLGAGAAAALGAALAAFGFGGALALRAGGLPTSAALAAGGLGAVVVGGLSYRLSRVAIGEPAQPHRTSELHGVLGSVVTRIPMGGLGEVALVHNGDRRKLSARAEEPLPAGTRVYVTEILSETAVFVTPLVPVLPEPKEPE